MRAMILLALLLAILALFSFYEPLAPYWKIRFSAVMACLDEGRYSDALAAAMEGNVPGDDTEYWEKSEPLGEAGPVKQPMPVKDVAAAEEVAAGGGTVPEEEPPPVDTTESAAEIVSGM